MNRFVALRCPLVLVAALALSACGTGTGACYSSAGTGEECFQGWTEQECKDQNTQQVNGLSWTFSSSSCQDLGFSVSCGSTVYRRPGKSC